MIEIFGDKGGDPRLQEFTNESLLQEITSRHEIFLGIGVKKQQVERDITVTFFGNRGDFGHMLARAAQHMKDTDMELFTIFLQAMMTMMPAEGMEE